MEFVDVIDSDDHILSTVSKDEAHAQGLLHKCVIGALFNGSGELMLIKPPMTKQDGGKYVFPVGGHVSSGEPELDALKREVEEEIGITEFDSKKIRQGIFDRQVLGRHENHLFVLYEIYSDQIPTAGSELESMHWFTRENLKKEIKNHPKDFGDAFYFVFERFYPEFVS